MYNKMIRYKPQHGHVYIQSCMEKIILSWNKTNSIQDLRGFNFEKAKSGKYMLGLHKPIGKSIVIMQVYVGFT